MAPPKNGRKKTSKDALSQLLPDEILQVRATAIKLLEKINKEIDLPEEMRQSERFFGAKASLVDTLVTLADLLLRLAPPAAQPATTEHMNAALNEKDMAVVKAFLARSHKTPTATT